MGLSRLKKNRKRELYFSLMVDLFVIANKTHKGEKIKKSDLVDILLRCTHTFKTRKNKEFCNTAIAEFMWMGMINYEEFIDDSDVYVYALEPLFDAFRSRVFHSNYASFEDARASRIISIVAIVIALISLFINMCN